MNTLEIMLTTEDGDELGRLPVPAIQISQVTEESGGVLDRSHVVTQMERLLSAIGEALDNECLECVLDGMPFQAAVSLALADHDGAGAIVVMLPVREASSRSDHANSGATGDALPPAIDMDGLFDIIGTDAPAPEGGLL